MAADLFSGWKMQLNEQCIVHIWERERERIDLILTFSLQVVIKTEMFLHKNNY